VKQKSLALLGLDRELKNYKKIKWNSVNYFSANLLRMALRLLLDLDRLTVFSKYHSQVALTWVNSTTI
jgi:hypothetical protein